MSEQENNSHQGSADSGQHENENQQEETKSSQAEMVSKQELEKVLNEMHSYKKKAKEYEAKIKEKEVSDLKKQQEWQKIAELKENEALEAKEKAERLEQSFLSNRKYDALKEAAIKNGIRPEALRDLELIDFENDVAIETTSTGKINVIGSENAIKKLKAERPYWFGKSVGKINTDTPETVDGKPVTIDMVMKEQENARKSGDWNAYKNMLLKYQAQKQ